MTDKQFKSQQQITIPAPLALSIADFTAKLCFGYLIKFLLVGYNLISKPVEKNELQLIKRSASQVFQLFKEEFFLLINVIV